MGDRNPPTRPPVDVLSGSFAFDRRLAPSANVVLRLGAEPILVDCGADSPASRALVLALLARHGLAPADLRWLVCTHFHVDHVGNAAWLQREFGVAIAAHAEEAEMIESGHPAAFDARWLGHEARPFRVDRRLRDGDEVGPLRVVETPSQTPGHIALHDAEASVVVTGDLLQAEDVAWVRWAPGALEATIAAVHRLAGLGASLGLPGHGPPVHDVPAAVRATLARYETWRERPELAVRHGIPRALVSNLAVRPSAEEELLALPWLLDAATALDLAPEGLLGELVGSLAGRGVVRRRDDGRLEAAIPVER